MKPIKIYRDTAGLSELIKISKKYLVKATDGKSMVVVQAGKVLIEKGKPLKGKRELVIALYMPHRKIKAKNDEYLVYKVDTRISRNIIEDIREIRKARGNVIIEAFSKVAKKVILVYRGGNLTYINGNYKRLLNESKAILDVYEIIDEDISEMEIELPGESKKVVQNTVGGE
ncbi:hypothetical protein [Candidatus Pyrohabitans sp.]